MGVGLGASRYIMMSKTVSEPGNAGIAAYAAGSLGTGVFQTVPTVLLLYFSTEILHIPAALAALAVFVPKAWGIVWDPFVGAWSDRTHTRIGRRRPFLVVGTAGVAISFVALFSAPNLPPMNAFIWVACTYFALASLYSFFAVPYIALPAEIGGSNAVRARMVSWRMTVAMIGVLTGAGVAPILVEAAGGGRHGYAIMSLWVAGACAIAMSAPLIMLRGRDVTARPEVVSKQPKLHTQILLALRHRRFAMIVGAYVLQIAAVGISSSATPYIVTEAFGHSQGDVGLVMLVMMGLTAVTVPLWSWIGRRVGDRRALAIALLLFICTSILLGFVARLQMNWTAALLAYAVGGIPFAGMQVLPFTIIAHLIHDQGKSGTAAEGAYTGVLTASEKLGLALGPALTGIALSAVHGDVPKGLTSFLIVAPALLAFLSLPLVLERGERAGVAAMRASE